MPVDEPVRELPSGSDPQAALFEQTEQWIAAGQPAKALEGMAAFYLERKDFARLFEVRKLQSRLRLGIPAWYVRRPGGIPRATEEQLERDLAVAALEAGQGLAAEGDVASAWGYLRAVEDEAAVRTALIQAPVPPDQIHAAIEICLHQQAAPAHGMRLALKHLGTCSSISLFDSVHGLLKEESLPEVAAVVVDHLCREVSASIVNRLGLEESEESPLLLEELLARHPVAVARSAPHLDPSHLYSVLRIGRTQSERVALQQLLALAQYAGMLPESLQYAGDVPFENAALHHQWWYSALLGKETETASRHFTRELDRYQDPLQRGVAREYAVLLLWRTGRQREAVELALNDREDQASGGYGGHGIGPHPIAMACEPELAGVVAAIYRQRGDLLGFTLTRLLGQS